jgi:hypothetical protein
MVTFPLDLNRDNGADERRRRAVTDESSGYSKLKAYEKKGHDRASWREIFEAYLHWCSQFVNLSLNFF